MTNYLNNTQENGLTMTSEDIMINVLQTNKVLKAKTDKHEEQILDHDRRIQEIEDNQAVTATLNNYLSKIRRQNIVAWLGGKKSKAYNHKYAEDSKEHYKTFTSKVFAEAERAFKQEFNVAVYGETRKRQYEEAVKFWQTYKPSDELEKERNFLNNQMQLFENEA